ncbi:Reverse transcriptase domain-containing protein [Mycena chlorophos]|uniref:Reverse transcriptase domain-containing protein n=1 Tax=Mycena chlorophos TaxID=658473 RepID=A0A8H6SVE7_MYCCL|nr:Reverse transcriptase domain-containing protein [Mycena chlorophos]
MSTSPPTTQPPLPASDTASAPCSWLLAFRPGIAHGGFNCAICNSISHPTPLCPLPDLPGWNGPTPETIQAMLDNSRAEAEKQLVNETHMSPAQVDEINNSHMNKRLKIFHSAYPDNTAAKGIALVINREVTNDKGVKFWPLIPGKAFLAQVPWYKRRTITILGVYAPTESERHKREFWDELSNIFLTSERNLPAPDILAGDFNVVESELDRLPSNADDGTTISALRRLTTILGLEDGWRRCQ